MVLLLDLVLDQMLVLVLVLYTAGASFGPHADLCASSPSPLSRLTSTSALLQEPSSGANLSASELYACLDNDSIGQYDDNFNVLNA